MLKILLNSNQPTNWQSAGNGFIYMKCITSVPGMHIECSICGYAVVAYFMLSLYCRQCSEGLCLYGCTFIILCLMYRKCLLTLCNHVG